MRPKRRRTYRRGTIRRRIPANIVPKMKLVRLEMAVPVNAAATTVNPTGQNVSVFDLADPLGAGGTQQPTGLDQWGALYKYAVVVGVKVTLTCHNAGAQGVVFGITPIPESYDNTGTTPWAHQIELPGTKYRFLSPEMDHGTLSASYSTKKWLNIRDWKDNKLSQSRHVTLGTSGTHTNPTEIGDQISCWVALHNGTTSTDYEMIIKMSYIVLLFERRIITRSTD
uniref:hypothetical protein n=1 Tax=Shewanella sp. TaxID=50422 RepID=UPI004048A654